MSPGDCFGRFILRHLARTIGCALLEPRTPSKAEKRKASTEEAFTLLYAGAPFRVMPFDASMANVPILGSPVNHRTSDAAYLCSRL
jgi:hypothetical protein